MKGIADTGLIVAFANRSDEHHDWALSVAEQVTEPLLTCEPVLAEAAFHLQSVTLVLAMIREGFLKLSFDCGENLPQLEALAARYADREDFRIYRRNKREIIPLICPPNRKPARP